MNAVARVKKSLRAPIKKLANCVSGLKGRGARGKRSNKRDRGRERRGGCRQSRRTPPFRAARGREPMVIRSYQADLEKERQVGVKGQGSTTCGGAFTNEFIQIHAKVICYPESAGL